MAFKIIAEKCAGCGTCVDACPVNAIEMKDGVAEINESACLSCGACAGSCPVGAIQPE